MRGSDGKLCFSEKGRGNVWMNYMERIMNEENDWDRNVEGDAVEGPVECVSRYAVVQALNEMITRKASGSSDVLLELFPVSGGVGTQMMAKLCQMVLE